MAPKDITEKILESYNDVFADIVNVLLFDGAEIIKPDELVDQAPRAAYKADGKIREMERDVAKRWEKQNIRIACVGLENQTKPDPDMPLRVIGYDGAEYRAELNGTDRYPVVTLVLYFGHKKHWDKPLHLSDCFDTPAPFRPYVNDYKVNLFEIAYLTEEKVKLFKSDFGVVADYFVQKRKYGDYNPEPITIRHVQEVLQLLSVMTGDHRFEKAYNMQEKGESRNMCEVLDRVENRGIAKGMAVGMEKGMATGMAKGMATGMATGIVKGETVILALMQRLFAAGRIEDAQRASTDKQFREQLLAEFGLLD